MILAIDQGTSATKACVFAEPGSTVGSACVPVTRSVGSDGQVTQDPHELADSCGIAAGAALRDAGVRASALAGVALANQGESFLLFDRAGDPLTPVVSWQDVDCGDVLARIASEDRAEAVEARTGLPLHAEFVAPKLAHRLQGLELPRGARFGTLDTWLVHQLDPSHPHVTDRATASRTMLIGLRDDSWDAELLEWFGIPDALLPAIVPCDAPGATVLVDGVEVPLWSSGYDMGLALLGHGCTRPGDTKATFGTCLGVMTATGDATVTAEGLLTAFAYGLGGRGAYALDGEITAAGSLVAWAIGLGIAGSLEELDALAASVPDAGGLVIVPALNGLGAPHWRDDVRGTILGLSGASGRPHFARAVLDSIAWSLADVVAAVRRAGFPCHELRVDGGLTGSDVLMRRCADVARTTIRISAQVEGTAYGAAALAMLANGLATESEVRAAASGDRRIEPGTEPSDADHQRWRAALDATLGPAVVTDTERDPSRGG